MSAVPEVVAKPRAAVARLPKSEDAAARTRIADELAPRLGQLSKGTASQDLVSARAKLRSLVLDIERVLALLRTVEERTEKWVNEHGEALPQTPGGGTTAPPPGGGISERAGRCRAQLENPWPYGR